MPAGTSAPRYYVELTLPGLEMWPELHLRMQQMRKLGHRILVLSTAEAAPLLADAADEVVVCEDVFSADALAAALAPYAADGLRFSIIGDRTWSAQFGAAQRLGLPFPGMVGQLNCRIKPRLRRVLADTMPLRATVFSADEATPERIDALVAEIGLPFVVKPIWGAASSYVGFVQDREAAHEVIGSTFAALAEDQDLNPVDDGDQVWDPRRQILVEEFITEGRELSYEAFVQHGRLVPLLIQEKYKFNREGNFHFETANLCPTPFVSAEEETEIHRQLQEAMTKLEVDDTFVHVECKWDGERIRIIEVNSRIGGGSVPKMLNLFLGIDPREMTLKLALGETLPTDYPRKGGFLLGVFVNAHEAGEFVGFEGLEWGRERPEFSFDLEYLQPGTIVPPRDVQSGRERWLFCYDVFYHCNDQAEIPYLYEETLRRVRLRFAEAG
ncbi:ATP-grasp domain-containing protein [Micromonospora sp. WMMD714]|uniref:ATP-grasp domain-containing protein n=1 Tax=Micromonospora sp. WMMD714 TaxID=3016097 RepID=UPI00249BDC2D|nr:ATP-grasp domain-containing protein [Micromonospora sp. WMMD714]WFE63039.1 ATP-grasp domain-containing protein [Micromonospora sp. WMMD714]